MNNKPSFAAVAALVNELTSGELEKLLSSDVRPSLKLFLRNSISYPVTVNYDLSLEQMLKNARLWQYYEDDETFEVNSTTFAVEGRGVVSAELRVISFNKGVTSREVLDFMRVSGLEPARVEHAIAFVLAGYLECVSPAGETVVALGTIGRDPSGEPCVVGLDENRPHHPEIRILDATVDREDRPWNKRILFLAVKPDTK